MLIELVYSSSMAGPEAFEEEPSHSRDVDQLTLAIPFPLPHLLLIQTRRLSLFQTPRE